MQKANEFLTDQLISKFADALGGLDAIEKPEVLSDELQKDDLLKNDVIKVVEKISPYIPFLGFLSGGITTAKHVYEYKTKNTEQQTSDKSCSSKENNKYPSNPLNKTAESV